MGSVGAREGRLDGGGRRLPELAGLEPVGERGMGANPHTDGGWLLRDLHMPEFRVHAVNVVSPGAVDAQDTLVLGKFLREVMRANQEQSNFRLFGPDATLSNLLGAVFEVTDRQWDGLRQSNDEFLAPTGRGVDSLLSEQLCAGCLEGSLPPGRPRRPPRRVFSPPRAGSHPRLECVVAAQRFDEIARKFDN